MYIKTQTHTPIQTQSDPFSDTHHGRRSRQQRLRHRFNSYIFLILLLFQRFYLKPNRLSVIPLYEPLVRNFVAWLYTTRDFSAASCCCFCVFVGKHTSKKGKKKQFFKYFPLLLLLLFLLLFYDSRRRCRTEKKSHSY